MDIQVATLCDSASDYGGKLCILGAFDTICAHALPVVHPQCALAVRFCFQAEDDMQVKLRISLINADGADVIPPFEPTIEARVPVDGLFVTRNLVLNLQRLTFKEEGAFSIDISSGDEILRRIPLRVILVETAQSDGRS